MATAAPALPREAAPPRPVGAWTVAWRRLRRDRIAIASAAAIVLVLFAVFAGGPIVSHLVGHGPNDQFPFAADADKPLAGFWSHVPNTNDTGPIDQYGQYHPPKGVGKTLLIFGADGQLGRDLFLRTLYGGRVTLAVALGATLLALLIGLCLGGAAAYFGGWTDAIISRFTDFVMAFPLLLFVIFVGNSVTGDKLTTITFGVLPKGVFSLIVLIGGFTWFYPARIVRAQILTLKDREFVEAATMTGSSDLRILRKHLFPHVVPMLVAYSMIAFATNILLEAGVTFLGAGVHLPVASWGTLIGEMWGTLGGRTVNLGGSTVWQTLLPSIAISVSVISFNQLGDALRAALDPRAVR